jgi:hypothetical protein
MIDNTQEDEEPEGCINLYRVSSDSKFSGELELINYLDIFEVIYEYLDIICKDFSNKNITENNENKINDFKIGENYIKHSSLLNTTFEKEMRCLGIVKLYEIEYIKAIFDLVINIINNTILVNIEIVNTNVNRLVEKIIETGVFNEVVKFFFEFQLNNQYQIIFEKVFQLICNKSVHENLITHIFNECKLKENIIEHLFSSGISFKSGNAMLPGYFAILCNVANLINHSENVNILRIIDKCKFNFSLLI